MLKYTKGPWKTDINILHSAVMSKKEDFICDVQANDVNKEEANTHLIALSPEMFEALCKIERMEIAEPNERTIGDLMSLIQAMKSTARLVIAKMEKKKK